MDDKLKAKIFDYTKNILKKEIIPVLEQKHYRVKDNAVEIDALLNEFEYIPNFNDRSCKIKGEGQVVFSHVIDLDGSNKKERLKFRFNSLLLRFNDFEVPKFEILNSPEVYLIG